MTSSTKESLRKSLEEIDLYPIGVYGGYGLSDYDIDAILKAIEAHLPNKVHYDEESVPRYLKPAIGENWQQAIRHEQGYNDCLYDVRKALGVSDENN